MDLDIAINSDVPAVSRDKAAGRLALWQINSKITEGINRGVIFFRFNFVHTFQKIRSILRSCTKWEGSINVLIFVKH